MKRLLGTAALLVAAPAAGQTLELVSPDGANRVVVTLDRQGVPNYTVQRRGELVLAPAPIALDLDRDMLGWGMAVTGSEASSADTRYKIVLGKAAEGRDRYNQRIVHLQERGGAKRRMDIILRAYDDGIAFRMLVPVQPATAAAVVRYERTGFYFPQPWKCWGFNVGRFGSSHEGEFDPVDTTRLRDHNLFDVPFVCETGKGAFAIAEADLIDFAAMYLTGRGDGGPGLQVKLSPSLDDPRIAVHTRIGSPIVTPWRVVMLADRLGTLQESTLLTSLSSPSRIEDTSWIQPGLTSWDWWSGPVIAKLPGQRTTTAVAKAFIDFAAANGMPYTMIDEGWYAGAGGGGVRRPGVDITKWADAINLQEVADYARAKKVRLWLWAHWQALDEQMEDALALYEKLGVAGIKIDFMERDDQWMVNWYQKLLGAAARHHLMVDLHGAFAPRGLTRTWPNFVTQEGVMGAEYNKWSTRATAGNDVMLAYTRGLLGPMDYTPGGFRNVAPADFRMRGDLPMVQSTRAHGLAMYVVFLSPLQAVADSPDTYAASPAGFDFLRQVPTSWDETRFLAGETGAYIVLARRKGKSWYLGAMNDGKARTVSVPLDFLGPRGAEARIWSDGAVPDAVQVETKRVSRDAPLTLTLAATGGTVAVLQER
ncbi:glycoside hydrolase family 97 protein [Sphingomonas sp. ABOLD]|uniref:Alpha-glucosidase n=1 Tax=Sphingomonas trueperi TaxID=53317 RepID=A0A7X5Y061_9SPHN|nr:glycoside hydrolase family 97 protein [Sphingomonas sp. ABOLD]NJB98619.1 alpha-glucosidase [Sphingomonas trueperi]RSV47160.1 glycoside hydrolase family 97 protein [Sphingomonas sp. ABOLD]